MEHIARRALQSCLPACWMGIGLHLCPPRVPLLLRASENLSQNLGIGQRSTRGIVIASVDKLVCLDMLGNPPFYLLVNHHCPIFAFSQWQFSRLYPPFSIIKPGNGKSPIYDFALYTIQTPHSTQPHFQRDFHGISIAKFDYQRVPKLFWSDHYGLVLRPAPSPLSFRLPWTFTWNVGLHVIYGLGRVGNSME